MRVRSFTFFAVIGLVAAVPVTTWLAATIVAPVGARRREPKPARPPRPPRPPRPAEVIDPDRPFWR